MPLFQQAEQQSDELKSALEKTKQKNDVEKSFFAGIPNRVLLVCLAFTIVMIWWMFTDKTVMNRNGVIIAVLWILLAIIGRTKSRPFGIIMEWEARALLEKRILSLKKSNYFKFWEDVTISVQVNDQHISGKPIDYSYNIEVTTPIPPFLKNYNAKVNCITGNILMPQVPYTIRGTEKVEVVIPKMYKMLFEKMGMKKSKDWFNQ